MTCKIGEQVKKLIENEMELERQTKELIKSLLDSIPDNPKIKRHGDKAFSISAKDLGTDNWTAFYHDFNAQKRHLIEMVNDKEPVSVIWDRIKKIIETGRIGVDKLNPKFISELKRIFY